MWEKIKMAKGLTKEIIAKGRLKIGEGLAGVVAQDKKPLFLHENIKDKKIRSRLHNPELKYSILIPIKVREKLLGVLNVGTSRVDTEKFTSRNVNTIDMLTQLVETTLSGLPSAGVS